MKPYSDPLKDARRDVRSSRASKWAELCLWAVGVAALGYCGYIWADAQIYQSSANREFDRSLQSLHTVTLTRKLAPKHGSLVGRIEIPRLDLSVVVFEGTDSAVLRRGVGHLTGSALPGQKGNVVLAAHRDTFFRPLRNIRPHDIVSVATPLGKHEYEVESTEIVKPTQVSVLAPTSSPTLTLVTCYPFHFFGHAPKRFIVRAKEVDGQGPLASGQLPVANVQ